MFLETKRLIIRSLHPSDEKAFIEMASDGSLTEIYGSWCYIFYWHQLSRKWIRRRGAAMFGRLFVYKI